MVWVIVLMVWVILALCAVACVIFWMMRDDESQDWTEIK